MLISVCCHSGHKNQSHTDGAIKIFVLFSSIPPYLAIVCCQNVANMKNIVYFHKKKMVGIGVIQGL